MRTSTIYIDFEALKHNLARVRELSPRSKVIAVIKSNGYGHGMLSVARQLSDADAFAVAMIGEAIELREQGIEKPIIVFHGYSDIEELKLMEKYKLQPVAHQMWQLDLLESHFSESLDLWVKVDTGMHRLGLPLESVEDAVACLSECENIGSCRVMSHFANADEVGNQSNQQQLDAMMDLKQHCPDAEFSIANSAAITSIPESHLDWVRPGIMLYGSSPLQDRSADDLGLKPVMQFESKLIAINHFEKGDAIGYGSTWRCPEDMKVGVVGVGYGDGYPRAAGSGTPVWLNGERCPIVGRVSMDSICIDLSGRDSEIGDRIVLWGKELSVDDVASSAGTIGYELLCHAGSIAGLN